MTEKAETEIDRTLRTEDGYVTPLKAERIQLVERCRTGSRKEPLTAQEERDCRLEAGWRRRTVDDSWRPRRRCA